MQHARVDDGHRSSGRVRFCHEADGFPAEVGLGRNAEGVDPEGDGGDFRVVGGVEGRCCCFGEELHDADGDTLFRGAAHAVGPDIEIATYGPSSMPRVVRPWFSVKETTGIFPFSNLARRISMSGIIISQSSSPLQNTSLCFVLYVEVSTLATAQLLASHPEWSCWINDGRSRNNLAYSNRHGDPDGSRIFAIVNGHHPLCINSCLPCTEKFVARG